MTDRSKYVLRTDKDLSDRYLTYAQAAEEIERRTGADGVEILLHLQEGHTFENEGRVWSPLTTAVERWVTWNPNTYDARVFVTLDEAEHHLAQDHNTGYAISPVYA